MHRRPLNDLLARHARFWPGDTAQVARFARFVAAHADCLSRRCVPGHITASAWIVSADGGRALLTHHKKLGRWLQLGGHVDGEPHVERACLREAQEESGLVEFEFVRFAGPELVPLDLDVHGIPARGAEPAHDHWDVRFLLRVLGEAPIVCSDESNELAWFAPAGIAAVTDEPSVLRLGERARALLG